MYAFDAWANMFGDVQAKMEFTMSGEVQPVSRFAYFNNVPELNTNGRQVMDVERAEDLKTLNKKTGVMEPSIIRPKKELSVLVAPATKPLQDLMADMKVRAQGSKAKGKPKRDPKTCW